MSRRSEGHGETPSAMAVPCAFDRPDRRRRSKASSFQQEDSTPLLHTSASYTQPSTRNDDPNHYALFPDPDGTVSGHAEAQQALRDPKAPQYPTYGSDFASWIPHLANFMGQTSASDNMPTGFLDDSGRSNYSFAASEDPAPPFAGSYMQPTVSSFASDAFGGMTGFDPHPSTSVLPENFQQPDFNEFISSVYLLHTADTQMHEHGLYESATDISSPEEAEPTEEADENKPTDP
ncbi:hypothetical protein BKA62DRAFT_668278 [Auriculariales sp. MPI-PUGE-AT-0066]|nr:hypothetical protein BKA62DRAFT_668278 [Auriculariales sp. MPI-PUGE-AT-0066]